MKLFFYYLFHSAKNALKKLFKTWVLLFFVIMLGGGLILGATIGTLLKKSGARLMPVLQARRGAVQMPPAHHLFL